ncbi:helix-turn-helix transcriptional regulator [Erysipelatoclostridium ramosum]|uniref:helix-turn-helix transcriptional regulator n=1 Tax=Thomasclavelia ramosa TaxID=1547 RepID=UPI0002D4F28B|nr:helix-turn-helix transcriptional regulator [Thomasclavelia ramosa]MCI7396720.1 helix-turn-helix transcriptional regulator [Thomasclavelia ramosa]MDB7095611.1 helix-turn-helix transcriptional regulator [Thomasclavelia ramosa]UBH43832.1 helix-turn-helix transcriptional regulator [Thomasclavelia ramosa]
MCLIISYGSLSDLISGRSAIPRLDTIVKIAQVLDLNDHEFAELCGYKNDK